MITIPVGLHARRVVTRCAFGLAACILVSAARAQFLTSTPWTGVLETYFQAARPTKGAFYSEDWLELRNRVSNDWKVVLTYDYQPGDFTFDANFVEYDQPDLYVRMGRFRSDFGFGQWSDTNYNVEIGDPLIRQDPILPNLGLDRLDVGAEVQKNFGQWQLTVSDLDVDTGPIQMQPENMSWQQARLQSQVGPVILGANGLVKGLDPHNPSGAMYSTDFRWTTPQFRARGEFVSGDAPGYSTKGYYVDLTYRLSKLFRTELGVRNEAFDVLGSGQRTSLTTVGVRQIVGNSVTFNLNYVFGQAYGDFTYMPGWSLQAVYFVHF